MQSTTLNSEDFELTLTFSSVLLCLSFSLQLKFLLLPTKWLAARH